VKVYSLDLRERILRYVRDGGKKTDAARQFNVGRDTVYRYLRADADGTLEPRTPRRRWRKLDPQKLAGHVAEHADATPGEIGEVFGVSVSCVWAALRKLRITLKKAVSCRERDDLDRWLFRRHLESLVLTRRVYFMDECGIGHRLRREHGRAPRGETVGEPASGARRGRASLTGAWCGGRFLAPMVLEGGGDRHVTDLYFRDALLPGLEPGSVIVLDNASFHRAAAAEDLARERGVGLLRLPAYSPDLNPIEHFWARLKKHLRKWLPKAADKFGAVCEACRFFLQKCTNAT
jgi:Transposase and inactivated derivatives